MTARSIIQKDAVIGYLAQNQDIDSAKSVLEEMQDAKKDVIALEQELNDITEQMNHASGEELEHLDCQKRHSPPPL